MSYKTVPGLGEIIKGNGLAKQIRDVAVEDLLGRSPARLDEEEIAGKLDGKVILVTGAGGSIGSELCRQIARFRPEDDCRLRDLGECPVPSGPGDERAFSRGALSTRRLEASRSRSGWPKCWTATIRRSCTMRPPTSTCQ